MSESGVDVRQSDAYLRSTLENLLEGAQIIDREWRYVYVNPAAARHGGRSVQDLAGRSMIEAYPGIEHTSMFAVLRRSMETGTRTELENEFITPDGSHKWFQLVVEPVPEGLFILSLEITDRRLAEERLLRSQARFHAVIENLHEGLLIADLQGKLLDWNRAALTMHGFSPSDDGRAVFDHLANLFEISALQGAAIPFAQWPLPRVLRGDVFEDLEVRVRRIGTEWDRLLSFSGATVRYADDETLAFLAMRDITERKELERQFVRAQRIESIGSLASGIAHDLNNILQPILMGSEVLRRYKVDDRSTRMIDNIERSARRGADLVKQILSFARGVSGAWAAVNIRSIFAEIEALVTSTFPRDVTLAIDVAIDISLVDGDTTELFHVLLNLCVNARDAMPHGGLIRIVGNNTSVSDTTAHAKHVSAGQYVMLEVTDEGTGMTNEVMERMFEPFYTTKEIGKGTGLGLFTVRDIVRSHRGFIDVFSEVGRGTTFRIFLPAHATAAPAQAEESPAENIPLGNGELIMIVDDELSILSVAQQTLEAFGYEAVTAEDGAHAIALYVRHRDAISLVVTDMMMPVVDGAAMIAALLRMNPALPIIATSGSSNADWKVRAERAGARRFLRKPYTASLLLRTVAEIFGDSHVNT